MRVYYFSPETGIYQGDGFQDVVTPDPAKGITTLSPPPYGRGEVPVFDAAAGRWELCKTEKLMAGGSQRSSL